MLVGDGIPSANLCQVNQKFIPSGAFLKLVDRDPQDFVKQTREVADSPCDPAGG